MPPALSSSPGLPPAPQHDRGAAADRACGAGSPRVRRIEHDTEHDTRHDIGRDTVGVTDVGGTARVATVARPRARTRRPAHDAEARRACEDYLHRNLRLARVSGLFYPLLTLLAGSSLVLALLMGGRATLRTTCDQNLA